MSSPATPPELTPPSMPRAILCFAADRRYYRDVLVSPHELFCSPYPVVPISGVGPQSRVPAGEYDLPHFVSSLPEPHRDPELLVVRYDAARTAAPRNLHAVRCPRVLIVADMHHQKDPIRSAIAYARAEPFDLILVEFNRNLTHFLVEAGLRNVHWLPAFTLSPSERPIPTTRRLVVTFAGQVGHLHPYRTHVLQSLSRHGIPVQTFTGSREQVADVFQQSRISLNVSLNGDLNLRVFESLASGAFLVTDRLSPESGLQHLFDVDRQLVCFDDLDDLTRRLQQFAADPAATLEIAHAGQRRYLSDHNPSLKIRQFFDLIHRGVSHPAYRLDDDRRIAESTSSPVGDAALGVRLVLYELLQELHRTTLTPRVLFSPSLDERFVADAVDLPRLLATVARPPRGDGFLMRCALIDRVTHEPLAQRLPPGAPWDLVVATRLDVTQPGLPATLFGPSRFLAVVDADDDDRATIMSRLHGPVPAKIILSRPLIVRFGA